MGYGKFTAGSFKQDATKISGAQSAQSDLCRRKVIDASLQVGKVAANQIKLDLIERSGTGRGAKVDLATGILPVPRDAGREIEELC